MDFEKNLFPQDEQPQTPADIPAENALPQDAVPCSPTDEEVLFDLNQPQEEPVESAPKKKSKKGLIIGIIAAVAAVAILFAVLCFCGMFDRNSGPSSSAEQHKALIAKMETSLYSLTDQLSHTICNFSLSEDASTSLCSTLDAQLQLGSKLSLLLKTAILQSGVSANTDWMDDISVTIDRNGTDTLSQFLLNFELGDASILSLEMIEDSASGDLYVGMPGLNPYYLHSETDDSAPPLLTYNTLVRQGLALMQELIDALPDEASLQTSLRSYVDVLLAQLKNPTSKQETVTIGDATKTFDALTYQIPLTQLIDMAQTVLQQVENDDALEKLITAISHCATDLTLFADPYGTQPDMYGQFLEAIESTIQELETAKKEVGQNNYLALTAYLDSHSNICGYQLDAYTEEGKAATLFSWISVANGKEKNLEIVLSSIEEESLRIVGTHSTTNGAFTGSFDLFSGDVRIMNLALEELHVKDHTTYGSIQLTPSEEILESFLGDIYPVLSMLGTQLGVRLDLDGTTFGIHLTSMGKSALGLICTNTPHEPRPVNLPDAESVLSGPDASNQWYAQLDFDALWQRLEEAGIPVSLFEALIAA